MPNSDKFLRLPEVLEIIGISRSGLYARLDQRSRHFDYSFPRPIKMSSSKRGAVAWLKSEILAWMKTKIAERDKKNRS